MPFGARYMDELLFDFAFDFPFMVPIIQAVYDYKKEKNKHLQIV